MRVYIFQHSFPGFSRVVDGSDGPADQLGSGPRKWTRGQLWVSPSILAVAVYDIVCNWRQVLKSRCESRANVYNELMIDKLVLGNAQLIYYLYSLYVYSIQL